MRLLKKHFDVACLLLIITLITTGIHRYLHTELNIDIEEVLEYTRTVRQNIKKAIESAEKPENGITLFAKITETFKIANQYKLAHCEIPKVMSTVMMNVFCYLYDNDIFNSGRMDLQTGWWTNRPCASKNEIYTYIDVNKHLFNGYNITVLIREPFTRFISAFMNKCIAEPYDFLAGNCPGCRKETCFNCNLTSPDYMDCVLTRLTENLLKVDEKLNYSRPYQYELSHMAPYTWFCNMKNTYNDSIFLRYHSSGSKKTKMIHQLASVLASHNVPDYQLENIRTSLDTGETTWHATLNSQERSIFVNQIKNNSTLFMKLLNIYRSDFKIFDFPLPTMGSPNLFSS